MPSTGSGGSGGDPLDGGTNIGEEMLAQAGEAPNYQEAMTVEEYNLDTLMAWRDSKNWTAVEAKRQLAYFVNDLPVRIGHLYAATGIRPRDPEEWGSKAYWDALEEWCVAELRSEYREAKMNLRPMAAPRSEEQARVYAMFLKESESRVSLYPSEVAIAFLLDVGISMAYSLSQRHELQWALPKRKPSIMHRWPYLATKKDKGLCPFTQPRIWFARRFEGSSCGVFWLIYSEHAEYAERRLVE